LTEGSSSGIIVLTLKRQYDARDHESRKIFDDPGGNLKRTSLKRPVRTWALLLFIFKKL